jgi:putative ABC transport system substrate-binding protein
MRRREFLTVLGSAAIVWPHALMAQQPERLRRVGVLIQGDTYHVGVDGLRVGLKALGIEEGSRLALLVRDTKGDLAAIEVAARAFEREEGVDLIVALATSVALAAKRSTEHVPIVFVTGSDPAALGLVDTIARPGGRLTGLHSISTDLTSKRLEFLREIMPRVQRVVTFYSPGSPVALSAVKLARDAARRLGIELVEQTVTSTEDIHERLRALSATDEAYFFGSDAMVNSQGRLIVERANALRMAVIAYGLDLVREGALIGYGFSYRDLGRRAAVYVSRILAGARPSDLPVEAVSVPGLAINLKTAKALGIEIPPSLISRADEVIE